MLFAVLLLCCSAVLLSCFGALKRSGGSGGGPGTEILWRYVDTVSKPSTLLLTIARWLDTRGTRAMLIT